MKNFGEKGAWAYPGTAQFFWVPPIIWGKDKATNFKFGRYIQRVHANKSPLKIWQKIERGRIKGDSPNFLSTPYYLRNFKFGRCIQWVYANKSPVKKFGRKGSVSVSRTAQFFLEYPLLSRTGKDTNFKFCMHILSIDRNKSPLQIPGKVTRCVVRTLETFQGTHIFNDWWTYIGRIARSSLR